MKTVKCITRIYISFDDIPNSTPGRGQKLHFQICQKRITPVIFEVHQVKLMYLYLLYTNHQTKKSVCGVNQHRKC